MKRAWSVAAGAAALGLIVAAVWYARQEPTTPAATAPPVIPAPAPLPPEAASVAEPAIKHPIEVPVAETAPAAPLDFETALADLFGRKAVLSLFQTTDFARRFVATVDNLGRSQAPASLWPVIPTSGRFTVAKQNGVDVVSADNGLRYSSYVLLIEGVDLNKAVGVYARMYPVFQQAYQDLGFPKRYFNDRLVEVIDLLLATPDVTEALKVRLPQINGPLQPERPWVLYEFENPALQTLSSGQKIMLRMGPVNERRMKGKLAELRRLLTAAKPPR